MTPRNDKFQGLKCGGSGGKGSAATISSAILLHTRPSLQVVLVGARASAMTLMPVGRRISMQMVGSTLEKDANVQGQDEP